MVVQLKRTKEALEQAAEARTVISRKLSTSQIAVSCSVFCALLTNNETDHSFDTPGPLLRHMARHTL
jgi:hypothetical protein